MKTEILIQDVKRSRMWATLTVEARHDDDLDAARRVADSLNMPGFSLAILQTPEDDDGQADEDRAST